MSTKKATPHAAAASSNIADNANVNTKKAAAGPDVHDRLHSPSTPRRRAADGGGTSPEQEEQQQQPYNSVSPSSSRPNTLAIPCIMSSEYLSELRSRQNSQLTSVAAYLEAIPPIATIPGPKNTGWTYGASFSRQLERLQSASTSYPVTSRSKRVLKEAADDVLNVHGYASMISGRGGPMHHNLSPSRPHTARTATTTTASVSSARKHRQPQQQQQQHQQYYSSDQGSADAGVSLFQVVKHCNSARPTTVQLDSATASHSIAPTYGVPKALPDLSARGRNESYTTISSSSARAAAVASGRPLSAEYHYAIRNVTLTAHKSNNNNNCMSKADAAIAKHQQRQRKLELQREKLRNEAPMQFSWS